MPVTQVDLEDLVTSGATAARTGQDGSGPSRRPSALAVLAGGLGLLALVSDAAYLSLLVVLLLAAPHMPARTHLRRLALAALALFGVNASVLTTLAVLEVSFNARALCGALLLVGVLSSGPRRASVAGPRGWDSGDAWATAAASITFVAAYRPMLGAPPGEIAALLARGTDAGNHFSLVLAVLHERGYIGLLSSSSGVLRGMEDYPSAWAGNTALVVELVLGRQPSPGAFLALAALLVSLLYALLAFFATVVALDVARAVRGQLPALASAAATGAVLSTTVFGTTALLLFSHSYTQIAATTLLLASVSLVVDAASRALSPVRVLAVLALLTVGTFQTWYLLAPVLASVLLVHLLVNRPPLLPLAALALPAGACAAYPVVTGPRPDVQLLAPGGAPSLTALSGLALLVVTLVGVVALLHLRRGGRWARLTLAIPLVICLLMFVGTIAVQQAGDGGHYYAMKLLYSTSVLSTVAGAAVMGSHCSGRGGAHKLWSAAVAGALLVGLCTVSYSVRDRTMAQLAGEVPAEVSPEALVAVLSAHPLSLPEGTELWIASGCSRAADRKTNQFLNNLYLLWTEEHAVDFDEYINAEDDDISVLLDRARSRPDVDQEVYVARECLPRDVDDLARLDNVVVHRV